MADPLTTDVFKFVALRTPQLADDQESRHRFIRDARAATADGRRQLAQLARSLPAGDEALRRWRGVDLAPLAPLVDRHRALLRLYAPPDEGREREEWTPPEASAAALEVGFAAQPEARAAAMFERLFDLLYVAYRTGADAGTRLDAPLAALRAAHFATAAFAGQLATPRQALEALHAKPLLPAPFGEAPATPGDAAPPTRATAPAPADVKEMQKLIEDVEAAQHLLRGISSARPVQPTVRQDNEAEEERPRGTRRRSTTIGTIPRVGQALARRPSAHETELLSRLALGESSSVPAAAQALQEFTSAQLQRAYAWRERPEFVALVKKSESTVLGPLIPGLEWQHYFETAPAAGDLDINAVGLIRPLGIGDLKVVKQKLLAYVPGEVAHIENVLKSEFKERKHRTLDRTETIVFSSEEETHETERDTQTTDRFEVKKEAEQTIKEDMGVKAGVTVTGQFGPVTVTTQGDFAYSTSKQESTKNSTNFARDVVDRSVSKVQKKIKTERTSKTFREVEETNTHGLDNKAGSGHITGVYRWVDKRYRAQVHNYGVRMMFEFLTPEPAAFFRFTQAKRAPRIDTKPPVPFTNALGNPLSPEDITEANYHQYVARYQAAGVTAPPSFVHVAAALEEKAELGDGKAFAKSTKDLVIPDQYSLLGFSASVTYVYRNYPKFGLQVGAYHAEIVNVHGANELTMGINGTAGEPPPANSLADYAPRGILPISVAGYDVHAYVVNVAAVCKPTREKFLTWRQQTYEKLYAAYKALKTEYDQKVAQAEAQAGAVMIEGRNPAINREIEKRELKKLCLTMLTGQHFSYYDAMKPPAPNSPALPEVDVKEALKEGLEIQFFEQAFDWDQITYLFYPYFWGRKSDWISVTGLNDPDPLFRQFLQAGSARVVVPVSPHYNEAVLWYLENKGLLGTWKGGEAPRLDDPLFKSIADELREQTDDLAEAKPEGEPWEYTLPTTLVWLQEGPELPVFEP